MTTWLQKKSNLVFHPFNAFFIVKLQQKEMFGAFHLVACGINFRVNMGWLVKKKVGVMWIKLKNITLSNIFAWVTSDTFSSAMLAV